MVRFDGFGKWLGNFNLFFTITTVRVEHLVVKEDINLKILEILAGEDVKIAFTSAVHLFGKSN